MQKLSQNQRAQNTGIIKRAHRQDWGKPRVDRGDQAGHLGHRRQACKFRKWAPETFEIGDDSYTPTSYIPRGLYLVSCTRRALLEKQECQVLASGVWPTFHMDLECKGGEQHSSQDGFPQSWLNTSQPTYPAPCEKGKQPFTIVLNSMPSSFSSAHPECPAEGVSKEVLNKEKIVSF